MFFFRKKKSTPSIDMTGKIPVIRSSICTGEQVAGFRDKDSGKLSEIMAIRNQKDLEEFLRTYGVDESDIRREW